MRREDLNESLYNHLRIYDARESLRLKKGRGEVRVGLGERSARISDERLIALDNYNCCAIVARITLLEFAPPSARLKPVKTFHTWPSLRTTTKPSFLSFATFSRKGGRVFRTIRFIFICMLMFALSHAALGQETTKPSADPTSTPHLVSSIQTQMDHGDFNGASVQLEAILKLHGVDATAYNRHQIDMMLVECRLHQNQLTQALRLLTFEKGDSRKTNNWAGTAEAYSLYALVFGSPKLIYIPTAGQNQDPLNVLDLDQRKLAYDDLFQVKLAAFHDELGDARDEGELKIVSDAADHFCLVRCLEQVTKSSTHQSDQIGVKLSKWSDNFIHLKIVAFAKRVTALAIAANVNRNGRITPGKPAGFTADERSELLDIRNQCGQMKDLIRAINQDLGHPGMINLPQNSVDAANMITRINALLTADSAIRKNRRS
jgi:hypothetical protein